MSLRLALALTFLLTLLVSVASWPLHFYGSDPVAVREEARALILTGSLDVVTPPAPWDRPGEYFVQNSRTGAWVSKYGLFSTLAVTPPLAVEYLTTGELPPLDSRDRILLLNAWNTVLTLLLAAVLVRLASLYTDRAWLMTAFALTTLFSTFVWNYTRAQSPELVQILLAAVAADSFLRHLRSPSRWRLLAVYAAVTALVLTRVYFVTLLPVVAVALLAHRRDRLAWTAAIAGTAAVLTLLAAANFLKFGSPLLTGYHAFQPERHLPGSNPLPALYGFLISAQKGVLWHFPTLLLALLGAVAFARHYRSEAVLLGAGIVFCFFPLCFIPSWAGEWGYGPRYLVFALPLLALPAVCLLDRSTGRPRIALLTLGAALAFAGTYLNFQVNRVEFFTANTLRGPLRDLGPPSPPMGWHDDTAPYPGRDYFDHRPWGLIVRDLFASNGRLERHPLADTARRELSPAAYEDFRRLLWHAHQNTNWWWATSGKRFNERRFDLPPDWNPTPTPPQSP
jgi:hypothetical protein